MSDLIILCYHGVTDYKSKGIENYNLKHINYKLFEKQIKKIKKNYVALSMNEVVMYIREKIKFPKNSLAVTFDDGFKNNYTIAAPILEKYGIQSTFYLSTGFIETEKMFWVDIVEDTINRTKKNKIKLNIDNKTLIFKTESFKNKIDSTKKIKTILKKTPVIIKDQIIKSLVKVTNVIPSTNASENYKKLSKIEIKALGSNKLFTIGAHTINNNSLTMLKSKELKKEISGSISYLSNLLKIPINHFSYPEGSKKDFNDQIIKYLKKSEIICSPSAIPGFNNFKTDPFKLKRFMIGLDNKNFII